MLYMFETNSSSKPLDKTKFLIKFIIRFSLEELDLCYCPSISKLSGSSLFEFFSVLDFFSFSVIFYFLILCLTSIYFSLYFVYVPHGSK